MSDPNHAPRNTNPHTRETHVEKRSGGSGAMAFIVGGLVVAVLVVVWLFYGGSDLDGAQDVNISVEGAGEAAQSVGDAASDAAESTGEAAESAGEAVTPSE